MNADELKVLENALAVIETLQAEIEALKKETALQRLSDFTQEAELLDTRSYLLGRYDSAKTLTNEEISDIRDEFFAPDGCNIYTFARALLKKASEI
jgi:PhoPQ-activated pathogenicity-related protein